MMVALVLRLLFSLLTSLLASGQATQYGSGDGEMSLLLLPQPSSTSILSEESSTTYAGSVFPLTNTSVDSLLTTSLFISPFSSAPVSSQLPAASLPLPSSGSLMSAQPTVPLSPTLPILTLPLTTTVPSSSIISPTFTSLTESSQTMTPLLILLTSPLHSSSFPSIPLLSSSTASSTPPYSSSLLPTSSELTTTDMQVIGDNPQTGIIIGAAAGGVVAILVVALFIVIFLVVRRKKKRSGKHTVSANKDFMMIRSSEDDKPCVSSTSTDDKLQEFGFGTNTFGISNFPDTLAPTNGEDLPALVFINPVDPSIPISSNTLPLRGKLRTSKKGDGDLRSHFGALFKESVKGHRSTGSIDKIGTGSTEPLTTDIKLQEWTKGKKSINGENSSSGKEDPKTMSHKRIGDGDVESKPSDSYGYLFMPKDDLKVSTFLGQSSSFYDVPNKVVAVPKRESSLSHNSSLAKVEHSATDRSHYDVPKKVLEEARARKTAENTNAENIVEATSTKEGDEMKNNGTSSSDQTDGMILETVEELKKTTSPNTKVPIATTLVSSSIKREGIYDVPRSILLVRSAESSSVAIQKKASDGPVRIKPKIAPRAATTKITSEKVKDLADTCKPEIGKRINDNNTVGSKAAGKAGNNIAEVMEKTRSSAIESGGNTGNTGTEAAKSVGNTGNDTVESGGNTGSKSTKSGGNTGSKVAKTLGTGNDPAESVGNSGGKASESEGKTGSKAAESPGNTGRKSDKSSGGISQNDHLEHLKEEKTVEKLQPPGKPQILPRTREVLQSTKSGRPAKPPVAKTKPAPPPRRTSTQTTPTS